MKKIDRTGERYGNLTVLYESYKKCGHNAVWHCRCDCGKEVDVVAYNLSNGNTRSCGCLQKRVASDTHKTHGMKNTRLYQIWIGMKDRCNNPSNKRYDRYGGRGISVCEDWQEDFIKFYNWAIDNGYQESLTIDRIDLNGNYGPNNCRWATWREQANNTSRNVSIELNGENHTLSEWADIYGINAKTLYTRIFQLGWDFEEALTTPIRGIRHESKK